MTKRIFANRSGYVPKPVTENIIQNREYYYRQAAKKEAERAEEEAKKPVRIEPKNTMAEINEMARAEGLTYGQMQGKLYCLEHPLIQRRGIR